MYYYGWLQLYLSLFFFFSLRLIWIILTTYPCLVAHNTIALSPVIAHSGASFTVLFFVKEKKKKKAEVHSPAFALEYEWKCFCKTLQLWGMACSAVRIEELSEQQGAAASTKAALCLPQRWDSSSWSPGACSRAGGSFQLLSKGAWGAWPGGNSRWGLGRDDEARHKLDKFNGGCSNVHNTRRAYSQDYSSVLVAEQNNGKSDLLIFLQIF